MSAAKAKKFIYLIFACVFLCMLLFNFMTPMVSDDFAHYYGTDGQHIASFSAIISNLKNLRENTNGRVFAHFFVYLFQIPPKGVFNFVNALISASVLFLFYRFFRSEDQTRNVVLLVTAVFMLWYFMPGFGQVFLWLTGSCNYSWGLALDFLLLYLFYSRYIGSQQTDFPVWKKTIYIIIAFLAGAWSENGASATIVAISLFTILIWAAEKKIPVYYVLLCAAALAGFAFMMTAPSELGGRAADVSSGSSIFENAKACLMMVQKYCTWLLASCFALLTLAVYSKIEKKKIISIVVLLAAGAVSVAVFAFAVYMPQRSLFILVSFTVLADLILISELWHTDCKKITLVFSSVVSALFLFSFILGTGDILSLFMQSRAREAQIVQSLAEGEKNITLKAYASGSMYPAAYMEELTESPNGWYNELLAKYYGLDSISGTGINYYFD